MSSSARVLVAVIAATGALACAGVATPRSAASPCGSATPFKGAPTLKFGPVTVAGFSSNRCAAVAVGCGPRLGGYQAHLALEVPERLASPVVLRASSRSGTVKFVLVANRTPAPNVPRCMSGRALRSAVTLRSPYMYFVLFVFAPKDDSFRLSATRGSHQLGAATVAVLR